MKTLAAFLVLAVVVGGWLKWENAKLTSALLAARHTVSQQQAELTANHQAIGVLQASAKRNERAQVILRQQLAAADALANRRNQSITRLLNENESLRRWYQSVLPDAVARLHRRPAFAHPDDYLRWLSEGQQLPDTGQRADH